MYPGDAFMPVIHPIVMALPTIAPLAPQEGDQAAHMMRRLLHRLVSRSTEANLAPERPPPSLARHRGQGPGSGVPLDARQALWCAQANTDRPDETQQPPPASIRIGVMSRTSTSPRLRLASSVICTCVTHGLDMGTNRIRSMMRTASSATLEPTLCHSHAAGRSRSTRGHFAQSSTMAEATLLPWTTSPTCLSLRYLRVRGGRERARRIGVAIAGLAQSRQCQSAEKLQVSISSRRESTVERLMGGDPRLSRRSGQDMPPMPAPAPTVRCPTQAPHQSHAGLHTARPVPRSINHTLPTPSINGLKHAGSKLVTVQTNLWCQAPSIMPRSRFCTPAGPSGPAHGHPELFAALDSSQPLRCTCTATSLLNPTPHPHTAPVARFSLPSLGSLVWSRPLALSLTIHLCTSGFHPTPRGRRGEIRRSWPCRLCRLSAFENQPGDIIR
ncbi:hypothetical protein BN1723_005418 [Verticillium longisporum]|uniref:Uncharacterized protein n=1 Tax=Verticillium longisporum TaxID=100787 RepID=A0A0G4N8M0_VERLO|nr:hypothetical protein BN1723_005418 [Verticillium longisporum]